MKDRIPRYAGRIKLIPVENQPNIYDMERADEPIQEGTPLNRHTLLSDQTIAMIGLTEDATPDDALRAFNDKIAEAEQTITEGLANGAKTAWGTFVVSAKSGSTTSSEIIELSFDFSPQFIIAFDVSSVAQTPVVLIISREGKKGTRIYSSSSSIAASMGTFGVTTIYPNELSFSVKKTSNTETRTFAYIAIG